MKTLVDFPLVNGPAANGAAHDLARRYQQVRQRSLDLVAHLQPEDMVVQTMEDVSPSKWHLAHTTWFFETFLLGALPGHKPFHPEYGFLFNSYYETLGQRTLRAERGNLTRPTVQQVMAYRAHVDQAMQAVLQAGALPQDLLPVLELGLQHEQQHQELIVTDIKFVLGHNPLFPVVPMPINERPQLAASGQEWMSIDEGFHEIGFAGQGFSFDNELGRHRLWLPAFELAAQPVTNAQWLEFMADGGYARHELWLHEGWAWVKNQHWQAPLYWHQQDGQWMQYLITQGLVPVDPQAPVQHISYYEADAFARWAGARLPSEFEWEAARPDTRQQPGWDWTSSAYAPYPGFAKAPGALGEYNGKFMVNQQVLRGDSPATAPGHSRPCYRNFFHADKRWQFSTLRLARHR